MLWLRWRLAASERLVVSGCLTCLPPRRRLAANRRTRDGYYPREMLHREPRPDTSKAMRDAESPTASGRAAESLLTSAAPLDAYPAMSSTTRTGGWSASSSRTSTTRSILPTPNGIVSPALRFGNATSSSVRVALRSSQRSRRGREPSADDLGGRGRGADEAEVEVEVTGVRKTLL